MMRVESARFVTSISDYKNANVQDLPQIALVGRSNVGKSSLINVLCGSGKLAKVSSEPGKTRLINLFLINDAFYLVDLPGYGYARAAGGQKDSWAGMMEGYLNNNKNLAHIFLLIDIRRDPTPDDSQMSIWIQHFNIPCTIIATKADKIAKSKRRNYSDKLSDKLGMTFQIPSIDFSSLDGTGKDQLLKRFDEILNPVI